MDFLRKLYLFGDTEQRARAQKAVDDIWAGRNGWCPVKRKTMRGMPAIAQIQEKAQDYSGFGLKSQTPARKSATTRLARAPVRGRGTGIDHVVSAIIAPAVASIKPPARAAADDNRAREYAMAAVWLDRAGSVAPTIGGW
jgi:hypothetical protein